MRNDDKLCKFIASISSVFFFFGLDFGFVLLLLLLQNVNIVVVLIIPNGEKEEGAAAAPVRRNKIYTINLFGCYKQRME